LPIVSVSDRLERADEFCWLLSPLLFQIAAVVVQGGYARPSDAAI
jgi:hypothetical protein